MDHATSGERKIFVAERSLAFLGINPRGHRVCVRGPDRPQPDISGNSMLSRLRLEL